MKTIIVAALISVAVARPQFNPFQRQYQPQPSFQPQPTFQPQYQPQARTLEGSAQILRSDSEVNDAGFHYAYETQNGIRAEETGREANGIQAQGSYSYTGNDGQVYSVSYSAGDNGFQAQGSHIPTPPPVPEEIARALQQNAADEASGIYDDGSYHEGKYASGVAVARTYTPFAARSLLG